MEYVEGWTLGEHSIGAREAARDWRDVIRLFAAAGRGLGPARRARSGRSMPGCGRAEGAASS
jgi:hypothetical protein